MGCCSSSPAVKGALAEEELHDISFASPPVQSTAAIYTDAARQDVRSPASGREHQHSHHTQVQVKAPSKAPSHSLEHPKLHSNDGRLVRISSDAERLYSQQKSPEPEATESGAPVATEGADDWELQNATGLDPQAYLRDLQERGDPVEMPDDADAHANGEPDDVFQETMQQIRQDSELEVPAPAQRRNGASKQPSSTLMKAANSERAKQIVPALQQKETFRMTSVLCVAVYQGCVFFNQYLVVKFLGKGACGKVYLVMDTFDNNLYALKITQKSDISKSSSNRNADKPAKNPLEDLRAEVAIMGRVAHPNMVCLREVIDDPQRNKVLIVMNYAEGGPILPRKAIAQGMMLPEDMCRHYFRDILRSLEYLHSQKIIHGDLKPENILLTSSGEVKLSDFGCSRVFVTGNEYFDRFRGTPAFLAPEIMKRQTHYRGRPVDIYAMGVCLYALVFGTIPFSASNLYKLFQRVQEEPVRFPAHPKVSPSLINLLERMLLKDPRKRITIPEIRADPWVTCEGEFPMKPFKKLFRHGYLKYDPDPPVKNYLKDMLQLKPRYVTFAPGTMVIQQGEVGYYLAFIVEGTADVCVKPRPGGDSPEGNEDVHGPQSNQELLLKLRERAAAAKERVDRNAKDNGVYRIALRKTGDVLGEMAFVRESRTRKATVMATSPLKVALYTYADIEAYGQQHPGAIHQLKQLCWQRDAELMHFAATYRLAESMDYFDRCIQTSQRTD